MASRTSAMAAGTSTEYSIPKVIFASSVGTMIEWYDFYIFGSLAVVLSPKFFPPETIRLPISRTWQHLPSDSWFVHSARCFSAASATW